MGVGEGMRKATTGVLVASLIAGGFAAAVSVEVHELSSLAWADEKQPVSFDYVKGNGVHTAVADKADMYVMASSETDHTGKLELHVYGKLKMPYTGQDIDVTDSDVAWMKPNQYMKSFFEWAPEDPMSSKYDKTIFRNTLPIYVNKGTRSIKMSLDGEEVDLAIPAALSVLDIDPLASALREHRAEYEAAKSAGMVIVPATAEAFEKQMKAAEDLLAEAQRPGNKVTQDKISAARQALNEAFSNLAPAPFERKPLASAIAQADRALAQVADLAKRGEGYEEDGYNAFYASYLRAKDLMATEDLKFIVGPREGGALNTQRDFDKAAAELRDLTEKLSVVKREAVDTSKLREAFYAALELKPAQGKGWDAASGRVFRAALGNAQDILNTAYPTAKEVDQALKSLDEATGSLVQINLDPKSAYAMSVRYRHHADNAPSHLIDAYFQNGGEQVKVIKEGIVPGSEVRIYLSDLDTVKKFDGYVPTTFFYASDDGTLGKVRLFTGRDGRAFVSFVAEANGDLDIKYEKGVDSRASEVKPRPKPDLESDKEGAVNSDSDQHRTDASGSGNNSTGQSSPSWQSAYRSGQPAAALPKTGDAATAVATGASALSALGALGFSALKRRRG